MDQDNLNPQTEVVAAEQEPTTTASGNKLGKKLFNYFLLGIVFVLIVGVVAIIVWATLDSRNANNAVGNGDTNATITNQSSATATTDGTNSSENTATPTASAISSAVTLPSGWQLLTDERSGVKYGLPVQSSYQPVTLNPVNGDLPKEWYILPYYFNTEAGEEENQALWGLGLADDILSFQLAYYPGRQERSNFACGGLCAGQDEIMISTDKGNTGSVQSLVNNMKLAADAYNAYQQNNDSPLRVQINNLQISNKWGANVASYVLEFTGGMGDDASTYYYLVANGRNAYAINTFGVDKSAVDQVLNTLVLP